MVEYNLCVCYGVIIPNEVAEAFQNNLTGDFCDKYLHCIDAWTNDKGWFFGIVESMSLKDKTIIAPEDIHIPKFEINKLEHLIDEMILGEITNWDPKYYVINFCY